MCKYAVPELRRAGGGSIINIASQLGHLGVPLRSPYCTTKAALIHFTRILAMDHAVDNIRANTISPGFILTERSSRRAGGKDTGARRRRAAAPAQSTGRAGGNRRRCGLSCLRRRGIRHRDRSLDRWRLCRLQRPDRHRRPTRYVLTIMAFVAQRSAAISKLPVQSSVRQFHGDPSRRLTVLPHFPAPLDKLLEPGAHPASPRSRSSA